MYYTTPTSTGQERGEIDLLVLDRKANVIFVQVKAA
jgi:Holliday junction resolvase-like predicted endonuclease